MSCAGQPGRASEPSTDDRARYAAARAAADHPNGVMDRATLAFSAMAAAAAARDGRGIKIHADEVVDLTLQLCAAPAVSAQAAGDKARFLILIVDWLARRRPATAALLAAARDCELAIWGGAEAGTG